MANPVANTFRQAAELNREDARRSNNIVHVECTGSIVVSGDIHGNRPNMTAIFNHARSLGRETILVLQEIIHGLPDERTGTDRSVELLNRAARMKINNPDKTLILMGNHDLAQFSGGEISKEGRGACEEFLRGIDQTFGADAQEVLEAVQEFCKSLPLAVRFENGLVVSHTLPSPTSATSMDIGILDREWTDEDSRRGGALYDWTWGRDQTPEQLESIAEQLDASFFILGHRHIFEGLMAIPPLAIAIDSSNTMGCIFEFRAEEMITMKNAESHVRRISKLR